MTTTDRSVHNGVGFNCDRRTNVEAFRRQILITFSAYGIVTMVKRFQTIKEVDFEGTLSGNRVRGTTIQSVIKRPKPHVGEIIVYGLVIFLLVIGAYWRNRVWNSELDLWTDSVKKSPHKDRPHYNLATAFMEQGRYQEAFSHLNEALRINPDYVEAHNNLGLVCFYQGKYQEAAEQYKDALRIYPNHARAHNNLGVVLSYQGKYQDAIAHLNEALRIDPNYAKAHNNLGNTFFYQGKYQEAINQYNQALRINPNFAEAHNNLGKAYLMIGNRGLALKEYEILKTINPGLATALYQKIK